MRAFTARHRKEAALAAEKGQKLVVRTDFASLLHIKMTVFQVSSHRPKQFSVFSNDVGIPVDRLRILVGGKAFPEQDEIEKLDAFFEKIKPTIQVRQIYTRPAQEGRPSLLQQAEKTFGDLFENAVRFEPARRSR